MANVQNLKPVTSKEEAREKGRKGGKASARKRKQKKLINEYIDELMSKKLSNPKLRQQIEALDIGIDMNSLDNKMALVASQWSQAMKGDTKAFECLMNYSGEKPVEKIQDITPPKIIDDV